MNTKDYIKYIKELFALSWPLVMGNLGVVLIGAGSVFVAAKFSTEALAAVSIANSIINCIIIFGMGLLSAISPVLANKRGKKEHIKKYFISTIEFSIVLAFLAMLVILLSIPLVEKIGFDPILIPMIKQFMFISAFSTFGIFLAIALKEYLQSFEIVFIPNLIAIVGVVINLFLNFALVWGWGGLPKLGSNGLAYADLIMRYFMAGAMLLYCVGFMRIRIYHELKYFKNLIKVGLPISLAILLEFVAFNLITLVMGHVAGIYAAAQNILITITNATFMIPLAISSALAVKVGYANGARNYKDLKGYSFSGIGVCVGFMAICAVFFWYMPANVIKIFTSAAEILKIGIPILILIGIYQIFDGLQVSLRGISTGLKRTKIILIRDFAAYWVIGLPLGFLFALKYHMNLYGLWIGIAISIFALSVFLLICLIRELKKIKKQSQEQSL